ncbi:MAG TPA: hypothetical protein VK982_09190 [Bacteroidales bacterium]|nr:hypothetical protein [Bacteroidales bacterium]
MKPFGIIKQWGKERSVIYFATLRHNLIDLSDFYLMDNSKILELEENGTKIF